MARYQFAELLKLNPTGILYGIDVSGILSEVRSSTGLVQWTPIDNNNCPSKSVVCPSENYSYAMAFDTTGNLFVVNVTNGWLYEVPNSNIAIRSATPTLPVPLTGSTTGIGSAALAIDPWSGTAYYADRSLYTLNLMTGTLTPVGGDTSRSYRNRVQRPYLHGVATSHMGILRPLHLQGAM